MFGSRSSCLLAVSPLILASFFSLAQTARIKAAPPIPTKPSPEVSARPRGPAISDHFPVARFPANSPSENGFPQLARAAGMIFSGKVTHIERHSATSGHSLETISITFHIENAIRGATPGRNLTISQWSGLWSSGQRYRIGERVLLFLYPRSKLGLTSLVAGPLGRFDVDTWDHVLLSARHLPLLQVDPILGGKSRVRFSDFALAVRQACEEE